MGKRLLAVLLEFCILAGLPVTSRVAGDTAPGGERLIPMAAVGGLPEDGAPEPGGGYLPDSETAGDGETDAAPSPEAEPTPQPEGTASPEAEETPGSENGEPTLPTETPSGAETTSQPETPEGAESSAPADVPGDTPAAAPPDTERTYTYTIESDVTVTATASSESGLPDNAQLRAERLAQDSEAYEQAVRSAVEKVNLPQGASLYFIPYDVYFLSGEGRIEPESGTVAVSMKFEKDPFADVAARHMSDDEGMEGPSFDGQTPSGQETRRLAVHILEDGSVENFSSAWVSDTELSFMVGSFSIMGPAMIVSDNPADFEPIESGNYSSDMGDFPGEIDICDEEGNPVPGYQLEDGENYTVKLHFEEPADSSKFFYPATKDELRRAFEDAGMTEAEIETALAELDGDWMFVKLGDDVTANEGITENDDVKVYGKGKLLLVRYKKDGESPYTEYDIEFSGKLSKGGEEGPFDIVDGSADGTYEPPKPDGPYMNKKALQYDPDTHRITYHVTITNPTDEALKGFDFKDVFSVPSSSGVQPKFLKDTLKVEGTPFGGQVEQSDGEFSFHCDKEVPPNGKVEIEYELDVSELVKLLGPNAGEFWVDNEATATPGETAPQTPLTDKERFEVDLGTLKKNGWIDEGDFWGFDRVIEWVIEAYDPYKDLYSLNLKDMLTQQKAGGEKEQIFPEIVGVSFENENGDGTGNGRFTFVKDKRGDDKTRGDFDKLLEFMSVDEDGNVTFDFSKVPPELREKLFYDGGKHLKMHIYTQYEEGDAGKGTYENTVDGKLPSEITEREDDAHVNVGETGVHCEKTGKTEKNGILHYTVTTQISANIAEPGDMPYGIGAGLIERLHVTDETYVEQPQGNLDIFDAIKITTVQATYTDDSGQEKIVLFTPLNGQNASEQTHYYGVYRVSQLGNDPYVDGKLNNHTDDSTSFSSYLTAIILNPTIKHENGINQIYGTWPKDLAERQVTLTVEYDIDPAKAYFTMDSTYQNAPHTRAPYQDCETLYEYLSKKGSVVVYNNVTVGIKSSADLDDAQVPMTVPLTKQGEAHIDLENGEKYIDYEVTFQNGEGNSAAIPKDTQGLVFHDQFDSRMKYMEGSLKATLYLSGGMNGSSGTVFNYDGSPCSGNTIKASWGNFKDSSGTTLQKAFNDQSGQYNIRFTYRLNPGENMPENEAYTDIRNDAWLTYEGGETQHVTSSVDFPTGALTKQAQLANGMVSFFVEINEHGTDMVPGSDELTVVDEATSAYLTLDEKHVIVQKAAGDGYWEPLAEGKPPQGFTKKLESSEDGKQTLTLTVPDSMHLRIWYTYGLTEEGKNQTEPVEISNTVKIQGQNSVQSGDQWSFDTQHIGASGSAISDTFTLKKIHKGTEIGIQNARFILYAMNVGPQPQREAEEEARRINSPTLTLEGPMDGFEGNTHIFYPAALYTTGEDGSKPVKWTYLRDGIVYALVESYVPDGFVRMEEPIFFRLTGTGIELLEGHFNGTLVHVTGSPGGKLLTVENEYRESGPGGLTVTKTVGGGGDRERRWHFRVELSDTSVQGQYGDMSFTDGVAEFTLKHGESKTASGLPEGVTYTVTETEANQDGYATTKTGDTGTIPASGNATAAFVNDRPGVTLTGDDSHLGFWLGLTAVSALGALLAGLLLLRGRGRNGHKARHIKD